jgi:trigger factor
MKIDIDNLSSTQRKIRVELPGEAVDQEFVRVYENLGRQAKIKGFRPGKAPRSVLQGIYGDEIKGQVLSRLVERSLGEVIKERGLKIVAEPEVEAETLEEGRDFSFSALVEIKPDVEAKNYFGVELKKVKLSVSDEQVEGALGRLREAHAQLVPVEDRDVVERGDFVTLDFSGTVDGEPIPGGKNENYSVEVGGGNTLPEFENALIGLKKDSEDTITVPYPADYFKKELAGKSALFSVTVREIKKKVLPALDDEFAKDHAASASLEELKSKIRAQLEIELGEFQKEALKEQLMERLVEAHSFELPESLIDRQVRYLLERQQRNAAGAGEQPSTEELRKELRPHAERQVKATLLLEKIAENEKVEVPDADVQKRIEDAARAAGERSAAVRQYYARPDARESLKSQMIMDRTIDLLLERAIAKEVEPTVDAPEKKS